MSETPRGYGGIAPLTALKVASTERLLSAFTSRPVMLLPLRGQDFLRQSTGRDLTIPLVYLYADTLAA